MKRLAGFVLFLICVAGVAWYVAPPKKPRGFSGLQFARMTPSAAARAPLLKERGALISDVVADSPAAQAGIKPGEVAAAIDAIPVTSARQASDIVRSHAAGDRISLTLYDETKGDIHPRTVSLVFTDAPPVTKKRSVKPPRTLARQFFYPPPMAANAAWSRRIAHGASIRPVALERLDAGQCSALAPDGWSVRDHAPDNRMIHAASGGAHAIYKIVPLPAGRDPQAFIRGVLHDIFKYSPVTTPVETRPFGFQMFNFGTGHGMTGIALWRMTGRTLSLWIAAVPAADAGWQAPLAAAVTLSLRCQSGLAPAPRARDAALKSVTLSTRCLEGACSEGDFAATLLEKFRLGYVHAADKSVFLVNSRRDFWQTGPDGPAFYRQVGGTAERLEPGRTN